MVSYSAGPTYILSINTPASILTLVEKFCGNGSCSNPKRALTSSLVKVVCKSRNAGPELILSKIRIGRIDVRKENKFALEIGVSCDTCQSEVVKSKYRCGLLKSFGRG